MSIIDIHNWLDGASGGAGPVARWIWASLVAASVAGFLYFLVIALA